MIKGSTAIFVLAAISVLSPDAVSAFSVVSPAVTSSVSSAAAAFITTSTASSSSLLSGRNNHPSNHYDAAITTASRTGRTSFLLLSSSSTDDQDTDDDEEEDAYADLKKDYPDLEFVNYNDPEYRMDRGMGDDDLDEKALLADKNDDETLAEIERMREERRRKNDEYQFETYHADVLRGGEVCLGEWSVYQTDTFMGEDVIKGRNEAAMGVPRLLRWDKVLKVVSRGSKIVVDNTMDKDDEDWMRVDGERIVHEERLATLDDFPSLMTRSDDEEVEELLWEEEEVLHVEKAYWPREMNSMDFRGAGGSMCVGKAYTICDTVPLAKKEGYESNVLERHEGPFSEMRSELGLQSDSMRFRVKLDYALLDEDEESAVATAPPPLHLRTLTICRETLDGYWPNSADNEGTDDDDAEATESSVRRKNQKAITETLFGPPGAPGGLYDPPPVGNEERATENYMLLNFEGGATVLLPHRLDQNTDNDSLGWVTSLDWTPGKVRYQVDRKVLGGTKLKGLKTLELSEVQGEDADTWRPRDGGADMRQ
mmetsp:Transcript_11337/g.19401  ORF Transcript_11337/g.19401 Transcript_11337/m.19401 type:complete len:539 (-) Transcript_11337:811-2427(-)